MWYVAFMQAGVSKSEFAAMIGVSRGRVSQWLRAGQIDDAALIGEGRAARINVEVARRQLDARLDLGQRLGANGKALVSFDDTDTALKAARLRQLELANERAADEAKLREGRYIVADDARQEMGRIAGRLIASFEGALPELADAIVANSSMSQRDALHVLRASWRTIRARLSRLEAEATLAEPEALEGAL
jgi:transcriptional regulator with XRE-family HTH domain